MIAREGLAGEELTDLGVTDQAHHQVAGCALLEEAVGQREQVG
jgi:hypothetical protein